MGFLPPDHNCQVCPRLVKFREKNCTDYPKFFNAPVPAFGELSSNLLVVGLAPGLQGANATGRPFTGDYAGDILYSSLLKYGFARGSYSSPRGEQPDAIYKDNLFLENCRITNAVRCVPPENKPEPEEITQCNHFLSSEIRAMPSLKVILTLGLVAHNAVLKAAGKKASFAKFIHGGQHQITNNIIMVGSYHCSRYNINTGRLSQQMFDDVICEVKALL